MMEHSITTTSLSTEQYKYFPFLSKTKKVLGFITIIQYYSAEKIHGPHPSMDRSFFSCPK
jgi:hypothetical protein